MAHTIITKNSSTAGAVPSAGSLTKGELAINVADRRLYSKDNAGNVIEVGGSGTVLKYRDNFTGDGSTVAFTLPRTPLNEELVDIYCDGVYQGKDTFSISGAVITFDEAPLAGASIEVITFQSSPIGETAANYVSYTPAGTGAVATTVQSKLRETVSVLDFGADPTGVADSTAAIQAALSAAASKTLHAPLGTYKVTAGLTLTGSNSALICDPGTVFDFTISGHTTDCLTLNPSGYAPLYVENLTLNCNNTGRNGIAFSKGSPKLKNVTINQPYQDAIAATLNSASSQWVENLTSYGLLVTAAGRHAFHVYMTGSWNGTPFFNETLIEQFEVRGVGRNFANAGAIRFTFDGTNTAPISGFTALQCNFDAQVSSAVAPVSHTVYAESVNSGVGSIESLFIKGGGWESTAGTAPGGLYNFYADAAISTKTSCIVGIVNYNWAYGVGPSFTSEKSNYYADANGTNYPSALQKADGYAFKAASGGYLGGFTNNPTAFRKGDFLVASGNTNVDISIGTMSDYSAQAAIIVTIFHKAYYDSLGFYGYGVYLVSPSRTNVNYVHSVVLMSGSANAAYSFTPASVTFSIPSNGTLRVTVPGGASVGGGGTNTAFDLAANRMFVDLPGIATALTI